MLSLQGGLISRTSSNCHQAVSHAWKVVSPSDIAGLSIEAEELSAGGGQDTVAIAVDIHKVPGDQVSGPPGRSAEAFNTVNASLDPNIDWFHSSIKHELSARANYRAARIL